MSEQTIHVLTEDERKAIREKKKFSIFKGQNEVPKPPYAMVNGALELNPEMLLDKKIPQKEADEKLFEYETEYADTESIVDEKTEQLVQNDNLENKNTEEKNEKVIKLLSDGEEVKKYIKPKKNIYLRNLPTLKLPEDATKMVDIDTGTKSIDSVIPIKNTESKIIETKKKEVKTEINNEIVETNTESIRNEETKKTEIIQKTEIDSSQKTEKIDTIKDEKTIEKKVIVKELNRNTVLGTFDEEKLSSPNETKIIESIIEEKTEVITDKKNDTDDKEKITKNIQDIKTKEVEVSNSIVSLEPKTIKSENNSLTNNEVVNNDLIKEKNIETDNIEVKSNEQLHKTALAKEIVEVEDEKILENKNNSIQVTNELTTASNITPEIANKEAITMANKIEDNVINEQRIDKPKELISENNSDTEEKAILEEANLLLKNAIVDGSNLVKAEPIKAAKKHMLKNIIKEEPFVSSDPVNEVQTDEIYSRFRKQDISKVNIIDTEVKEEKAEQETQVSAVIPEVKEEKAEQETQVSSVIPEVKSEQVENETQVSAVIPEIKSEQVENETQVSSVIPEVKSEQVENETQVSAVIPEVKEEKIEIETKEKSVSTELQAYLDELDEEIELPRKTRKLKILFSPKNIDSLIKTKQFLVELEEIFRRIINNLELKHTKNSKKTRTERVKELEKIKSVLINVVNNKNISKHDKELVEGFLEDVLKHDSFYRKEIIKALDSIEIVYPLRLLGLGQKVSLIKDVVEGKEINALIGNILSRIDNLIVYNRFEKRKIQKYYIAGEQDSKVNKIIHEFFNGNYLEFSDLAYKVRNEIENYDENRQVFTKVVEKFVKEEEKYRDKLKNAKIKNIYTLSIIFDQIINPRYDMDAKLIYLETFNSKKKLIY